jgi:hypothetical protein
VHTHAVVACHSYVESDDGPSLITSRHRIHQVHHTVTVRHKDVVSTRNTNTVWCRACPLFRYVFTDYLV